VTDDLEQIRRAFRDALTCRIATVRPDGGPHVAPRWFVWLPDAVWVATRVGDTTWEHGVRDPRVAIVIDQGRDWLELAGVRVEGVAEALPAEHPDLREPMSAWHEKYRSSFASGGFERFALDVPLIGFLRVVPSRVGVWDHRGGR
jgi:nitroimidazol reductase NimA-like FMN-containing flavoprotein (pyridoxamine 5'-phosphate oxidase superfamily)